MVCFLIVAVDRTDWCVFWVVDRVVVDFVCSLGCN